MVALRNGLRIISRFLPLALSASLVVVIIVGFEDERLIQFARFDIIAGAALLALVLDLGLGGLKWGFVLRSTGVSIRIGEAMRLWAGLLPVSFFAPFQTGHALYPVVLHNAFGLSWYRAIEVALYDKLVNLVATFGLIGMGQFLVPDGHPLKHWSFAVLGVAAVLFYFWDGPVFRLLGRLRYVRENSVFVEHPWPIRRKVALLAMALVYQASDALSMLLGCFALGLDVDPALVLGAFPLIMLLSYAPISVSGIGVRATMVPLLLGATFSVDEGAAAGALVTFLEYIFPALVGALALRPVLNALRLPVDDEERQT